MLMMLCLEQYLTSDSDYVCEVSVDGLGKLVSQFKLYLFIVLIPCSVFRRHLKCFTDKALTHPNTPSTFAPTYSV